jgi:hypothetical protein
MITMGLLLFMGLFGRFAMAQTTVTGSVTLSASASDVTPAAGDVECGVAYVQFVLDGKPIGALVFPNGTNNFTMVWDSTTTTNGGHTLTATAADRAGSNVPPHTVCDGSMPNIGTSNSVLITVLNNPPLDTTPPTITINPPVAGLLITTKTQLIQVAAFDPSGIGQISIRINGTLKAQINNQQLLKFQWNTSPYKGQTVKIDAYASDKVGNAGGTGLVVAVQR